MEVYGHVILYHQNNLVYTVVFLQILIFQQNNSAQTSVLFFEKLKIVEKQLCKLNCSYGKISHTLIIRIHELHNSDKLSEIMNYQIPIEVTHYCSFV